MARDPGLEELVADDLRDVQDIVTKTMFGGICWMWRGNLLCGARTDGMLARLGKGNDDWAIALPNVEPMIMGVRRMEGWVRLSPDGIGDDALRQRLLEGAQAFVATLPPK